MMQKWIRFFSVLVLLGLACPAIAADETLQYFQEKVSSQQLPEADIALKNKDYQKAFSIYEHFAEGNVPVAEYQLAYLYQNGLGVDKKPELAVAWYMKASSQGLPEAQFAMATLYYYGVGVEQGLSMAVTLYNQAASKNNPEAEYMLGYLTANGFGVTQ